VAVFVEQRIRMTERTAFLVRLEGFNIFNHGNYLGRGQTVYGDTLTVNPTFGQLAAVGMTANAIPAFANVDPPRMFQMQFRFIF
jgi:TPP-dependent trihydroxycyclohexane-1,2-dione (THcHDO) dehydratase